MTNKEADFIAELAHEIGEKKYRKLLKIVAKFSEKSYRRGAQQAYVMGKGKRIAPKVLKRNMWDWRFRTPMSKSVGLDLYTTSSLFRLSAEGWG